MKKALTFSSKKIGRGFFFATLQKERCRRPSCKRIFEPELETRFSFFFKTLHLFEIGNKKQIEARGVALGEMGGSMTVPWKRLLGAIRSCCVKKRGCRKWCRRERKRDLLVPFYKETLPRKKEWSERQLGGADLFDDERKQSLFLRKNGKNAIFFLENGMLF